jgi:hypothetical protein
MHSFSSFLYLRSTVGAQAFCNFVAPSQAYSKNQAGKRQPPCLLLMVSLISLPIFAVFPGFNGAKGVSILRKIRRQEALSINGGE